MTEEAITPTNHTTPLSEDAIELLKEYFVDSVGLLEASYPEDIDGRSLRRINEVQEFLRITCEMLVAVAKIGKGIPTADLTAEQRQQILDYLDDDATFDDDQIDELDVRNLQTLLDEWEELPSQLAGVSVDSADEIRHALD